MYEELKKGSLAKYRKIVERDLDRVNKAILKGAYLSDSEWFDFNFKSAFCDLIYDNTKKYKAFCPVKAFIADVYAEAFHLILRVCIEGYTNSSFVKNVSRIVKLIKKTDKCCKSYFCDGYDKDGILYLQVGYDNNDVPTYSIIGIDDAVETIIGVIRDYTDFIDNKLFGDEFSKFINGYIVTQLDIILNNMTPVPYTDNNKRLTLANVLSNTPVVDYKVKGKVISIV